MTDGSWRGQIAAERMQTDQEFSDRVAASALSSQQWGLVMTAVEFDIEEPENPDTARLVADTSKLSSVMDEIRRMGERGPGGMRPSGGSGATGDGLFSGIKAVFGLGEDDDALRETAAALAEDYTSQLQTRLEERGRWATICEQARS